MCNWLGLALILVLSVAWQAHAAVNCTLTGPGRFADPVDRTCKNYTYCVYDSTISSYRAYNYVCPTISVFNPRTAQCTAPGNYVCNVTSSNSTSSSSVCTSNGYIANPSSRNCSSYIECVNIDSTFIETVYSCPAGTFFEPNTAQCKSDYVCPFSCTASGRFADTADATCKTYYFCVNYGNSTYARYAYTCPSTSVFSPNSRVCTTTYRCPTSQ